jgi:hypothetical protein
MRPCSHNIHSPSIPPAQGGGIPLRAASWSLGCLPASWGCGGGGGGGGGGGEYSCITARSQADTWDPSEAQVTRDPRVMCPTGPGLPVGRLQQGLQLAGGGGGVPQADGPGVLCGPAAGPSGHPGDPWPPGPQGRPGGAATGRLKCLKHYSKPPSWYCSAFLLSLVLLLCCRSARDRPLGSGSAAPTCCSAYRSTTVSPWDAKVSHMLTMDGYMKKPANYGKRHATFDELYATYA